jgi:hypothetical protein
MKRNENIAKMNNFVKNHEKKKDVFNIFKNYRDDEKREKEQPERKQMKFDGLLSDNLVPEAYGNLYNNLSTIENFVNSTIQNNSRIIEDYNLGNNTKDISKINYSSDDSTIKMIKNEPHQLDNEFGGFLNYDQRQYLLNENSNIKNINSNEMIQYQPLSSTFTGSPIKQDNISLNRKIRNSHNKKSSASDSDSVHNFLARYPIHSEKPVRSIQQPYSYLYSSDNPPYNLEQDFNEEPIKNYQQNYQKVYQPKYREENKDLLIEKRSSKYYSDKEKINKKIDDFSSKIQQQNKQIIFNTIKKSAEYNKKKAAREAKGKGSGIPIKIKT